MIDEELYVLYQELNIFLPHSLIFTEESETNSTPMLRRANSIPRDWILPDIMYIHHHMNSKLLVQLSRELLDLLRQLVARSALRVRVFRHRSS